MKSFLYFTGFFFTIFGLIAIINEVGPVAIRYIVLVLGLGLLTFFFIKQRRN